MYSPAIAARRRADLERALHEALPFGLREYSVEEVREFRDVRFADLFDKKGNYRRELTAEESTFILNEQLLGKVDYQYFAERYETISIAGQSLGTLFPLLESQEIVLGEIGRLEKVRYEQDHPDGVILDVLKDRQQGISTLSVGINFHRTVTHANTFALIASDVPTSSDFLWDMYERMLDNLPWWMMPTVSERTKNDEIVYASGTHLFWGAAKSTRGADKTTRNATDGQKGQLGRGKNFSMIHLSEIATMTNPQQIDTSLEPGIPVSPMTFYVKESTAQGRGSKNYWHNEWNLAKAGKSRATAVFIPCFATKRKNTLPPPAAWIPSLETLKVARRYEEEGPRWMHRPVRATRGQLYWYEKTRAEKVVKGLLAEFIQEHPVTDDEAFQYSGQQVVLPALVLERVRNDARPVGSLIEILPQRELTAAPGALAG